MSVGQMLLAFFSPDPRLGSLSEVREGSEDAGADSFASLLASQNSGEPEVGLSALLPPNLPAAENLSLANDGKTLPDPLELMINGTLGEDGKVVTTHGGELDTAELTEGAQRWLLWLDGARAGFDQPRQASDEGELHTAPDESESTGVSVLTGAALTAVTPDALKSAAAGSQDALAARIGEAGGKSERKDMPTDQAAREIGPGRGQAADQQAQNAPLQRNASVALAAEAQMVNVQRMQDPEALTPRRSNSESDALDGLSRTGQVTTAQAQAAALTARPVAAPAQALGVPFGQPSWGEAMVEKVLWMSSQNVRSVEIRLDPAELGPLEIHIQNRGQENQVQFLSQNASVREALESQMFRLREMFTQQGMERVDVTVSDGSQRDNTGGQTRGEGADRRDQSARAGRETSGDASQSIVTTAAAAKVSSDRLVDYYA